MGNQQISKLDSISKGGIRGDWMEGDKAGRAGRSVEGQGVADLNRTTGLASVWAEDDMEAKPP